MMREAVQPKTLGILGIVTLMVVAATITVSGRAIGNPALTDPAGERPLESTLAQDFRIEATTDRTIYGVTDSVRLTVSLLNEGPFSVYVGNGPDEPTFGGSDQVQFSSPTIGYATLAPLDQGPVTCTASIGPDGTVIEGSCPGVRRYPLSLRGSNVAPNHSTTIICVQEIPLDSGAYVVTDPEDAPDGDLLPLEPGCYLLDCHIDGICGVQATRAQRIIEIRS